MKKILKSIPVITIDGPSGSGKGTISQLLAKKLGWNFLDSGALYRILALAALKKDINLTDVSALQQLALDLDVEFTDVKILLQGEDITAEIRTEKCSLAASKVAVVPAVREALLERQRNFRQPPGLVADGRDMGTVVFPDANIKIFLTASCEERAKRRHQQLQDKGIRVSLRDTLQDLIRRDTRDEKRDVAPLRPAKDATIIDTTDLGVDDVLQKIMQIIEGFCFAEASQNDILTN